MPSHKPPSPASVARSLDLPLSLLPHVGALFEGLDSLGSDPAMVARALAGVPRNARAIDLACGKGGVAVALGRRLRVTGVDACPAFVRAARRLAKQKRVRCTFKVGMVRDVKRVPTWDVALMLGLFGAEKAAPLLRRFVKPGGVYVIDDAFRDQSAWHRLPACADTQKTTMKRRRKDAGALKDSHRLEACATASDFLGVPTLRESCAVLEATGDEVIEEIVPTRRAVRELNRDLYEAIERNARRLAAQEPRLGRVIEAFLARQREGNALLAGPIRPAMWVVRKKA